MGNQSHIKSIILILLVSILISVGFAIMQKKETLVFPNVEQLICIKDQMMKEVLENKHDNFAGNYFDFIYSGAIMMHSGSIVRHKLTRAIDSLNIMAPREMIEVQFYRGMTLQKNEIVDDDIEMIICGAGNWKFRSLLYESSYNLIRNYQKLFESMGVKEMNYLEAVNKDSACANYRHYENYYYIADTCILMTKYESTNHKFELQLINTLKYEE